MSATETSEPSRPMEPVSAPPHAGKPAQRGMSMLFGLALALLLVAGLPLLGLAWMAGAWLNAKLLALAAALAVAAAIVAAWLLQSWLKGAFDRLRAAAAELSALEPQNVNLDLRASPSEARSALEAMEALRLRLALRLRELNHRIEHWQAQVESSRAEAEGARRRAKELLDLALPKAIGQRLMDDPRYLGDDYADVTVVGVAVLGLDRATTGAAQRIAVLNRLFAELDRLAAEHGIEKVRTQGDVYLAASGLPVAHDAQIENALAFMRAVEQQRSQGAFELPAGCDLALAADSGPVAAGIVGIGRFTFEAWGAPVDHVLRMLAQAAAGEMLIGKALAARGATKGDHPAAAAGAASAPETAA